MKPTIYDVAERAGVSISTVSKVLNGRGKIGEATKARIFKVMKELQYQPNNAAMALTGKSTYVLGIVIPDLNNPFFAAISKSVESNARQVHYSSIICSTDYNPQREEEYLGLLKRQMVDGIIIASGFQEDTHLVKMVIEEEIPVVLIARDIPDILVDTVSIDDFIGGLIATKHLLELGHQRIGVITEPLKCGWERVRGYQSALHEWSIPVDESLIVSSESSIEAGREAANKLFSRVDPPTALFATNDLLAISAIQVIRDKGLHVPEDVSVVGFDNTILAHLVNPALTTVSQPMTDMGAQAVNLLLEQIRNKEHTRKRVILIPELVVRGSTGPPHKVPQ
ncbi:LacI family DNA-binding transcriptional regulator [Alicyclobacillus kakegawensis]|uniref:LacI family DNA-binding transcriptional regulator n=1 Tax=Alicyclobacillus kakegawensis TaxID=392012 RepID=UPI00082DB912|nr:LacI family DNA-binding transcriptional regulator [Alicyclobacillus kakegawensis]